MRLTRAQCETELRGALMSHYDSIAGSFHTRVATIAGAVDALAPGLEITARRMVETALNDQRIYLLAAGPDAALATYTARSLRTGNSGLPPLPTIALTCDEGPLNPAWKDLRTLCRDGDMLLCIDCEDGAELGLETMGTALQRNLFPALLSHAMEVPEPAVAMPLIAENAEMRRELALMAMHTLKQLLGDLLMGDQ